MIMLDTDVIIEIADKESNIGEKLMNKIIDSGETYFTSSINFHELMYGIRKYSKDKEQVPGIPVINYTKEDADLSSKLELFAENNGKAVPRMDAMIASVAINNNSHLLTLDNHFKIFTEIGLKLFD
jgi:tRNA(fMet)-specific endonuclease VapC